MQVSIYKNLHNGKYSIKHNGLVIGHADSVTVTNCELKVSEAGRQRVLKERSKNVHAFVCGDLCQVNGFTSFKGRSLSKYVIQGPLNDNINHWSDVTYNPYKGSSFKFRQSGNTCFNGRAAHLDSKKNLFKVCL